MAGTRVEKSNNNYHIELARMKGLSVSFQISPLVYLPYIVHLLICPLRVFCSLCACACVFMTIVLFANLTQYVMRSLFMLFCTLVQQHLPTAHQRTNHAVFTQCVKINVNTTPVPQLPLSAPNCEPSIHPNDSSPFHSMYVLCAVSPVG